MATNGRENYILLPKSEVTKKGMVKMKYKISGNLYATHDEVKNEVVVNTKENAKIAIEHYYGEQNATLISVGEKDFLFETDSLKFEVVYE